MLNLYGEHFNSRFILGTARYPSPQILKDCILAAKMEIVTVSLKRCSPEQNNGKGFWNILKNIEVNSKKLKILPNTAGCYTVSESVTLAKMAREIFQTNWIKLEITGDEYTLQPNPFLLLQAAEILLKENFCVFPYMTDDLILAKELVSLGCKVLMPWAAPIGSGQGVIQAKNLQILRERFPSVTLIVDAGIGAPSHACHAMELGMDAILLNTAVATARFPAEMSCAFATAISAGKKAYDAGLMPKNDFAVASSPVIGTPFCEK